jgi:hypothetical protein
MSKTLGEHPNRSSAIEIRKRAERRLGEMMKAQKETGGLAKGGGGKHGRKRVIEKPTLKSQSIDKNLADRARKAAAMSEEQFEKHRKERRELPLRLARVEGGKPATGTMHDGLVISICLFRIRLSHPHVPQILESLRGRIRKVTKTTHWEKAHFRYSFLGPFPVRRVHLLV